MILLIVFFLVVVPAAGLLLALMAYASAAGKHPHAHSKLYRPATRGPSGPGPIVKG